MVAGKYRCSSLTLPALLRFRERFLVGQAETGRASGSPAVSVWLGRCLHFAVTSHRTAFEGPARSSERPTP